MIYTIIAIAFSALALLLILAAAKLLLNVKWIAGFAKGISGIAMLVVAVALAFTAKDISSYKASESGQMVATISFKKKNGSTFQVDLQEPDGVVHSFETDGQQWRLSTRVLRWSPLLGAMGFRPGYKLEEFSGRFIELQLDNIASKRSPESLISPAVIDFWKIGTQYPAIFTFVEAQNASSIFSSMADGAIFNVAISGKDLTITPLNDAAKAAEKSW